MILFNPTHARRFNWLEQERHKSSYSGARVKTARVEEPRGGAGVRGPATTLYQEMGRRPRITRIFHEAKMNACPASRRESVKPPPHCMRECACAGESLGGTAGREDSLCGTKMIHLLESIKQIYTVRIFSESIFFLWLCRRWTLVPSCLV